MARDKKRKYDNDSASNDRADELISIPKYGEFTEWDAETRDKECARIFTFGCGLIDSAGITLNGVTVEYKVHIAPRVDKYTVRATLFEYDKSTRQKLRVVQLDNKQPVYSKGGMKHDTWPHIHIGQERKVFDNVFAPTDMTIQQSLIFFEQQSNIYLDPEVNCDFNINNFELTPTRKKYGKP